MRMVHLAARALVALAAAAPWLWLLLFVALSAAATAHLGRLPRYNNPDPKTIEHLAWLHALTSQLFIATALSPLAAGAGLAVRSFVSPDIADERWRTLGLCGRPRPRCDRDLRRCAAAGQLVPGLGHASIAARRRASMRPGWASRLLRGLERKYCARRFAAFDPKQTLKTKREREYY